MLDEIMMLQGATITSEGFAIDNDGKADWAIRKIAEEQAELDRLEAVAQQQKAEIDQRIEAERKRIEQRTSYLRAELERYFDTVPHRKTKTKESYRLLSGSLTRKKGGVEYTRDDKKLAAWMQHNGYADLVKTEPKPAWGMFKKLLTPTESGAVTLAETGEVVDGVIAEQKPDTFSVEF